MQNIRQVEMERWLQKRCTDPNSSSSLKAATAKVTKSDKLYQACFLKRRQLSVVLKYIVNKKLQGASPNCKCNCSCNYQYDYCNQNFPVLKLLKQCFIAFSVIAFFLNWGKWYKLQLEESDFKFNKLFLG